MKNWQKKAPPYTGEEPYVYFAFAQPDANRVWPILRRLLERGVRVWYCAGAAGSAEELVRRQERSDAAALRLLYLSDAAVADKDTKSMILVAQKLDRPILCLDPDGTDRRLAMGLRETVPHFPAYRYAKADELTEELVRAEGFTQELFGESVRVRDTGVLEKLTAALCVLAVLTAAAAFAGVRYFHWFAPPIEDTVILSDPVILSAAREAVGGGAVTEESATAVRTLRLSALPESWDDLALLPALERLELPQSALLGDAVLPRGYTLALWGGDGHE